MTRLSVLVMIAAAACGGGDGAGDTSGVASSKIVTMLDTSEVTDVCAWAIEVQGGPGHVTQCGPDQTVTAPTQSKCESDYGSLPSTSQCMAVTVADVETCINKLGDDPCGAFESQDCAKWVACIFSGL